MFLFYLEIEHKIRWDRYQFLNLPAASSNHVGGAILSLLTVYSPQFSNVVKFILKIWKTVVQACKLVKSLSKKPWSSSKEISLIYYFSLPDEGGENKIYQFLGFSVYFWKFLLSQGGLSFYGSQKGDNGADTDLMFQFCLPYCETIRIHLTGNLYKCMETFEWIILNAWARYL